MIRTLAPGIVVGLILSVIYTVTMLPDLGWDDAPEFALAIDSLGIPHSPGFPIFVLTGRCIQILTESSGARSATIASALGIIGACFVIAVILRKYSVPLSIAAGLSFGLSPAIWFQATRGEVYGLHVFFVTALIALHLSKPSLRSGFLSGYLLTLGALTHPSILILGVILVRTKNIRVLVATVVGCILGLTGAAYLPIRSTHNPFLDWGNPETVDNFVWMVTLREFAGDFSKGELISHRSIFSALTVLRMFLATTIPPVMWSFVLVGIIKGFRIRWRIVLAGFSVAAFALLAGKGPDFEAYLLPIIPIALILGIEGVSYLSIPRVFIALTWILSLIILRIPDLHKLDRSHDISATRFQSELSEETSESILFTDNTSDLFLMLHHYHGERETPWVVYTPYLKFEWYRSSLPAPLNTLLPNSSDPGFSLIETCASKSERTARYTFSELPRGALGVLIPDKWTFHSIARDSRGEPWFDSSKAYSCSRETPGAHHLAIRLGQGGQLLSSLNQHRDASHQFSRALQFEPDNPALWLGLSRSHLHQQNWQNAFLSLKAMSMVPDLRNDYLRLAAGTALEIMHANPSIEVDLFLDSLAENHVADASLNAGAIRSALLMKSPRMALERAARYRGAMTSDVLNLIGTTNLLIGDFVAAESRFREALDVSDNEDIMKRIAANLIICLQYQGQYSKADSLARVFGFRVQG